MVTIPKVVEEMAADEWVTLHVRDAIFRLPLSRALAWPNGYVFFLKQTCSSFVFYALSRWFICFLGFSCLLGCLFVGWFVCVANLKFIAC